MPTYNFRNNETKEEYSEFFNTYEESQAFIENNTHITKLLTTAAFISGRSDQRLPGGFRGRLKQMKSKHPTSKGADHLL